MKQKTEENYQTELWVEQKKISRFFLLINRWGQTVSNIILLLLLLVLLLWDGLALTHWGLNMCTCNHFYKLL